MKKLFVFLLAVTLLVSCSLTNSIVLDKESAGQNGLHIETTEFFVGVVQDLSSWREISDDPLMDTALDSFVKQIETSHFAQIVSVSKESDYCYNVVFDFTSFSDLVLEMSGLENQNLISLSSNDGKSKLSLNLNLETYNELEKVVPFLEDKNFSVYGPKYNQDLCQEDYLMMMDFIFGEQASESILKSQIVFSVKVPEEVLATNGVKSSENSVFFSLQLIDFLLLHNPVYYWVEF